MCFRPATAAVQRICPDCGMINPGIAEKCIKCGASLPDDRIECPHCGEMMPPGSEICSECGTTLANEGIQDASNAATPPHISITPPVPNMAKNPGAPMTPPPPIK